MVLQADVAVAGMVFVGDIKFVGASVGTLVGLDKFIEVTGCYLFAIQDHFNSTFVAGDFEVIPLADLLHGVSRRLDKVVKSTGIVIGGARRVIDRDFDAVPADVFSRRRCERGSAHKNPAIASFADLEVQREHKILPLLGVDKHVMAGLVRIQRPLFHGGSGRRPIAVHPALESLAVEEQQPAVLGFLPRQRVIWPDESYGARAP